MEEKEKSKGFSLRSKHKRSRFSGQKPAPNPQGPKPSRGLIQPNSDASSTSTPRERPRPGGNTADLVKRRYSTRFIQPPDLSNDGAPPIPSIPTAPNQFRAGREPSPAAQNLSVDSRALRDPSLDAESYITNLLANASEQEIQDYQKSLRKVKNRASTDLQHNVYQNRTQFIKISKEAEKLKGEMRTLRGLMNELMATLEQASVTAPSTLGSRSETLDDRATKARKRANRSSVANLEAMWSVQLQALWKNVESSQKFLPAIPGRHVVYETGHWMELDAATWRPLRPVHIILLNDHLMVASRRRKKADPNTANNSDFAQKAATKLVAEKCWPLHAIDLADTVTIYGVQATNGSARANKEITRAITIRTGQESFTFRADKIEPTEKAKFLLKFRRTAEENHRAGKTDEADVGNKSKETLNYLATRDPAISQSPGLLRSLSKSKDRPEIMIDVDGKQRNLRWVEGQVDELDIEVALQRFEDAVTHVEKLRDLAKSLKNNSVARDLVIIKVDERASKLADILAQRLVDTHSFLNATKTNVAWLIRLSFDDRAREAYLKARTATITKRARQCVFDGDLQQYITQISLIYFTLIRNTVNIFQQCFPPLMMSACVKWSKERLDGFNTILARQLSSVHDESPIWQECLDRARELAAMMDEVGLDFKGLVGLGLSKTPNGEGST